MASAKNGTLYIGVTSNLVQRIWQHKNDLVEGFMEFNSMNMDSRLRGNDELRRLMLVHIGKFQ